MHLGHIDLRRMNFTTLATGLLLLVVGVAFVYSASYRPGPEGEGFYTSSPKKQLVWVAIGACAAVCVLCVHYGFLIRHAYWFYGAALLLVLATSLPGIGMEINGARRWIGVGPLRVQPSEFLKLAVILVLAKYLPYKDSYKRLSGLWVPFALTFVPMVLIARQPDLGTALVLLPVVFAALYMAGARSRHLWAAVLCGVLMMPLLWVSMKSYQQKRVLSFFQQESTEQRLRSGRLYHIIMSKTGIGSGLVWGKGFLKGTHHRAGFIPNRTKNNDFIFAVICEETGFVGANALLGLFLLFYASALGVAGRCRDPGGRLIVVGVVALFATQTFVNTAMTSGQLPTVGLPLPFISYGGSSMLTSIIGLALILNVSMQRTILFGKDTFD